MCLDPVARFKLRFVLGLARIAIASTRGKVEVTLCFWRQLESSFECFKLSCKGWKVGVAVYYGAEIII